jgi:hypothetical protein
MAVLTAMMFIYGGGSARAEISLGKLRELEEIVSSKDSRALWHYLHLNPSVMEGEDPLAHELRKFCGDGRLSCYDNAYPPTANNKKGDNFPALSIY